VREGVDLADGAARRAFLDRALAGAVKALVITEGLVVYLEEAQVAALGRDFAACPAIRWWMLDVLSPAIVRTIRDGMGGRHPARNLIKWGPANGVAFFEALGWRANEVRPILRWATRFRRAPWYFYPFMIFPDPDPRRLGDNRWSAVVRLERAACRLGCRVLPGGVSIGGTDARTGCGLRRCRRDLGSDLLAGW